MKLNRLCFLLPADFDEVQPLDREELHELNDSHSHNKQQSKHDHNRDSWSQFQALLRDSLHKIHNLKWVNSCCYGGRPRKPPPAEFHDTDGVHLSERLGGDNPRIFSFAELYIGTKGFSAEEILGSGGFGKVYRAYLPSDGTMAAVKCLAEKGEKFEKTFVAELVAVAHLRHRNLVRLRGWCVHEDQLFIVYDYMPNRSLDRVLFRRPENGGTDLSWKQRVKIVRGLAAALFYLHEQLETQIIHRDVKTSNVMLDSNYNAKLGDFGLARWLEHDLEYQNSVPSMSHHQFRLVETTKIGGTIGYLPPESFQRRSIATAKSDVFSFGIVLLEVVSGRRAVDLTCPDDQIVLLDWFRKLSDDGMPLLGGDNRLPDGSYNLIEMERLIHLGLLCTLQSPLYRPNMKWVVEALSGGMNLPALPSFQSHPQYISLSSTTNGSTTRSTSSSRTTATTITVSSSDFVSANGETIYMTAESGNNCTNSSDKLLDRTKTFQMIDNPRVISFKEIISATNNFSDSQRVAELDFGTAYHGFLDSSHHVLVKRLGMKTCPALRERFSNELENLGRLRHRNLIQLRGWCTEQGEMLVVYDYSADRLLSHLLFHHDNRALQWCHRYNIIKSLASAILYLHEEWDEQVIHKNITSSAVILDIDLNPKLSSFALAEFLTRNEHGNHHVTIDKSKSVRGIFGYMSPEYLDSGDAAATADVYSFGVVVLEVITGQMAVDFRRPEVLLVRKVHEFHTRKRSLEELADIRLNGEYNHKELMRMLRLGVACTHSNPDLRPKMRQIVKILDGNDQCFPKEEKMESLEGWKQRNATSLSLVRRIQALGIQ
ncbi:receptor like protein kinase S.2-like [Cucurbita pepo subsp. pepo]|uniref:receptor like protein kinase S.2-like n=1 Tax=Cucurbita pepo subsp. pepo TaxID=3664 RepID=UPI000C9D546F|nr:receptor like protein kinase S.2-like [Cucurbita pepo subsp. pepo]